MANAYPFPVCPCQVLDISRNNVRSLPAWLPGRLTGLVALRLHTNRLEELPLELKQLSALQVHTHACLRAGGSAGCPGGAVLEIDPLPPSHALPL